MSRDAQGRMMNKGENERSVISNTFSRSQMRAYIKTIKDRDTQCIRPDVENTSYRMNALRLAL